LDNYATHKHDAVERWRKRHRRFQPHYTPTSSSWLNLRRQVLRHAIGLAQGRQRSRDDQLVETTQHPSDLVRVPLCNQRHDSASLNPALFGPARPG